MVFCFLFIWSLLGDAFEWLLMCCSVGKVCFEDIGID